jgi:hypothetical protein
MARVQSITGGQSMADRKTYTATTTDRYNGLTIAHFQGPTTGMGPVTVSTGGIAHFVTDPFRFGATFDRAWIRRFYGETVDARSVQS